MGRKPLNIDEGKLLDLLDRGMTPPEVAEEMSISSPTIRSRIAKMQKDQGIILQYRQLQSLRLTELQHEVLENITPDKIADAPLDVLVRAFKILKDSELLIDGKPTEIKGLIQYLVEVEKREAATADVVECSIDVTPVIKSDIPNL